jgi:hypothetical protein
MLLEVSPCEEPLDHGTRVHGFSTRDIRARMLVRQRRLSGWVMRWPGCGGAICPNAMTKTRMVSLVSAGRNHG